LDDVLGLAMLALYIAAVVTLAAAVTFVAIRIFPTKDRRKKEGDDQAPPPSDDGTGGGRLFRKAKREATGT
jgi:hypothetical protein